MRERQSLRSNTESKGTLEESFLQQQVFLKLVRASASHLRDIRDSEHHQSIQIEVVHVLKQYELGRVPENESLNRIAIRSRPGEQKPDCVPFDGWQGDACSSFSLMAGANAMAPQKRRQTNRSKSRLAVGDRDGGPGDGYHSTLSAASLAQHP